MATGDLLLTTAPLVIVKGYFTDETQVTKDELCQIGYE
jgi:hypothetical protein